MSTMVPSFFLKNSCSKYFRTFAYDSEKKNSTPKKFENLIISRTMSDANFLGFSEFLKESFEKVKKDLPLILYKKLVESQFTCL